MSNNWVQDMHNMHAHYGVHEAMEKLDADKLHTYIKFRLDFLKEELKETCDAYDEKDAEEIVDGLIDLCVVAIGTLDLYGVDAHKAWDAVLASNMNKQVGVKPSRPNPLGLPDLIKPEGWTAPSHENNHGKLTKAFTTEEK